MLISKMGVKMNLKITTKNHVADQEKVLFTISISKSYGRATTKPTAWEICSFTTFLKEIFKSILDDALNRRP